jgi:arsenate reductase
MIVKIYHNPRCQKSRQALQLLNDRNIEPIVIEYLKNPPSVNELDALLKILAIEPRQLMRTKEAEYKENGLDNENLDRQSLLEAMVKLPKLIERPIVIANGKAVIGRPPEAVLTIL